MIRPTEEAELRAEEWPDDDTAREVELDDVEALGAPPEEGEPWRVAPPVDALADGEQLDLLAELEMPDPRPLRLAEAETTEDRIARRLEGIELGLFDALAPYREAAGSGALPDDDIGRALEAPGP